MANTFMSPKSTLLQKIYSAIQCSYTVYEIHCNGKYTMVIIARTLTVASGHRLLPVKEVEHDPTVSVVHVVIYEVKVIDRDGVVCKIYTPFC